MRHEMKRMIALILCMVMLFALSTASFAAKPSALTISLQNAAVLQNSSKHTEALAAYDAIIKKNPKSADAHAGRGISLVELKRYADAIKSFDTALKYNKKLNPAILGKALALCYTAGAAKAQPLVDQAVKAGASDFYAFYVRGAIALYGEKYAEALPHLQKATSLNGAFLANLSLQVDCLFYLNRDIEALPFLTTIISKTPNDAYSHARLASVYASKGLPELRDSSLAQALKLDPNQWFALWVKAQVSMIKGSVAESLGLFDKVLKVKPNFINVIDDYSVALYLNKQYAESMKQIEKVLAKKPTNMNSMLYRGMCKYRLADYTGATTDLEAALKLDPKSTDAMFYMGLLSLKKDDKVGMYAWFDKAIAIDPYSNIKIMIEPDLALLSDELDYRLRAFNVSRLIKLMYDGQVEADLLSKVVYLMGDSWNDDALDASMKTGIENCIKAILEGRFYDDMTAQQVGIKTGTPGYLDLMDWGRLIKGFDLMGAKMTCEIKSIDVTHVGYLDMLPKVVIVNVNYSRTALGDSDEIDTKLLFIYENGRWILYTELV